MSSNSSVRIAVILMLQFFLSLPSTPAEAEWQEAGMRIGIQAGQKHDTFHQYEAFAVYGLPWEWRTASGWGLVPQVSTSAGALVTGNETGFIGSAGTGFAFNKTGNGGALDAGINVDLLDRRQIGHQDFGSILQFGAYIGLSYRFESGLGISYRLHHLSNGCIFYPRNTPNPGLDMHLFGVSWNF